LGTVIGPSFSAQEMPGVVQRLIDVYLRERQDEERFIDTVRRIGVEPFKQHVYAQDATSQDKDAQHV
jgi:sulfite reductase (NADPH) hemoprotein beta-component